MLVLKQFILSYLCGPFEYIQGWDDGGLRPDVSIPPEGPGGRSKKGVDPWYEALPENMKIVLKLWLINVTGHLSRGGEDALKLIQGQQHEHVFTHELQLSSNTQTEVYQTKVRKRFVH